MTSFASMKAHHVDVAVIGAGTAGLVALREIQKVTKNFVLIQDGPYGTTCARVGCMPSKAFIQIAHDYHRRVYFERQGLRGAEQLSVDVPAVMRRVRELRDRFAGGMVKKTDRFGDQLIKGRARFVEPTVLDVDGRIIRAKRVIIATGSRPIVPDAWRSFGDRIWTSDTFFELETLPSSVAVVGLGVIGLELGQAMARLGIDVVGVARSQHLGGITDPEVLASAAEAIGRDMTLWRGQTAEITEAGGSLMVTAGPHHRAVEAVLVAIGRRPNVEDMGLENLGVERDSYGVPRYDPDTLQIGDLPVFIAGDVNTARPILHEAWDDGRVAGYNAVAERPACFKRRTPLHVVFSDPNIVMAGKLFRELDPNTVAISEERFEDQARALIRNDNVGILRLYATPDTGQLLGTEMCAPAGEHLGHLLAWCIQQRLTVHDLLSMPFYHPVIEEGLRAALESLARKIHDRADTPDLAFCDETAMSELT
jgi:dihydrolipoamide dehydrogenase